MEQLTDIASVRARLESWRQLGDSIALVATMGNLHKGHMELVSLAHQHAERLVVTVFVNPTQFGPGEDFEDYPRTMEKDIRLLNRAEVDLLFTPTEGEIYPYGQEDMTSVLVPGLSDTLCGQNRPGHFRGVTSVVCRLLNIVQPDVAVFGQKDYQQLVILRRMVQDLHLPVRVIAGLTTRDEDGLALSSRNQYLSESEREAAPGLYAALDRCRTSLLDGEHNYAELEARGKRELEAEGLEPDYFAIRQAGDLAIPAPESGKLVVLAAARLGSTRLIDNVLVDIKN